MNKAPLIRRHWRKTDGTVLLHGAGSSGLCHGDNLVMPATLIAFNIDNDRISEPKFATHQQRHNSL